MTTQPAPPSPIQTAPQRVSAHGEAAAGEMRRDDLESTGRILGGTAIAAAGMGLMIDAASRSTTGSAIDTPEAAAPKQEAPKSYVPPITATPFVPQLRPSKAAGGEDQGATPGEKRFNFSTYKLTAIGTFVISAVALYWAQHSKSPVWFGLTKSTKSMSEAWKETARSIGNWSVWQSITQSRAGKLDLFGWKPFAFDSGNMTQVGSGFLQTIAAFMGGNVMLAIILPREAHKAEIVHRLNEKHGTEEDVKRGDERVAHTPKQNWSSIVGGRLAAFATVFVSITFVNALIGGIGRKMQSNRAQAQLPASPTIDAAAKSGLEAYENWVGRGMKRVALRLFPGMESNTQDVMHKVGQSVAVDAFATAAAVGILETTSRAIAKHRDKKHAAQEPAQTAESASLPAFAARAAPREKQQPRAAHYTLQTELEKAVGAPEAVRG